MSCCYFSFRGRVPDYTNHGKSPLTVEAKLGGLGSRSFLPYFAIVLRSPPAQSGKQVHNVIGRRGCNLAWLSPRGSRKPFIRGQRAPFARLHGSPWCETRANEADLDGHLTPPYDQLPLGYQLALPMIEARGLIVTHNRSLSVTHAGEMTCYS